MQMNFVNSVICRCCCLYALFIKVSRPHSLPPHTSSNCMPSKFACHIVLNSYYSIIKPCGRKCHVKPQFPGYKSKSFCHTFHINIKVDLTKTPSYDIFALRYKTHTCYVSVHTFF